MPTSTTGPRTTVVIAEPIAPVVADLLGARFHVRVLDDGDRPKLLRAIRDCVALVVRSATVVDRVLLESAPALQVVGRAGVGLDNIDLHAAAERGIKVVNAPTANVVSTAEHAFALLMAAARQIPAAYGALRAGQWRKADFLGIEISGKTVGVIGLGRIGSEFARRIQAFDTRVVAFDPLVDSGWAAAHGIALAPFERVLGEADIISLHVPRNPDTEGMIGTAEFGLMRDGVIVINTARGGIVDERALYDAIIGGKVRAAGLDSYAIEPSLHNPLFSLPQVVATPHLGGSTREAQDRAGREIANAIEQILLGRNAIAKEAL